MISIGLAVTDCMSLYELSIPVTVFGRPHPEGTGEPWYELRVCGPPDVLIAGWLRTDPDHDLETLANADTVIVPACDAAVLNPPGHLVEVVREAHRRGARIASICTGAFVLAAAGVLDGRTATTHWMHAADLQSKYPAVRVDPDVLYVDNDDVLTSAGQTAGLDMCLHMARKDHGAAASGALARRLVAPPYRDGGQAQFIRPPADTTKDAKLQELLAWVRANLHETLTVADLAREAHMSTRNLGRHFVSVTGSRPQEWLVAQRIYKAQELLEMSDDTVETIAQMVGLGSGTTLRRNFNRVVGVSPDVYRRTFRGQETPATT